MSNSTRLDPKFVARYEHEDPGFGFNGLGYVVYKRTYSRPIEGRTEEWHETLERCVNGALEIGAGYTRDEAHRLYDHLFHMRGMFGGRFMWVGGTPMIRNQGGGALMNCVSTRIESTEDLTFLFLMLMHGCGVGFSVERSAVHEIPKVKYDVSITHEDRPDADFIVPDSREGWVYLLREVFRSYFENGRSFTYSTHLVRKYGEPLKTFGGTASGPGALIDLITDTCTVLEARVGKKLRSIDVLDIGNLIGRAVVAGSARRSAEIAGGDPDDFLFLRAKNWRSGKIPPWRDKSNNSIFADSYDQIPDEFWKGYDGSGEPYGLLNLHLARITGRLGDKRKDPDVVGFNPCGEIPLEHHGVCNLAELVVPRISSLDECQDVARLLYKTQKAITSLRYPDPQTEWVVKRNRRLGLSIMGAAQMTEEQWDWLDPTYQDLRTFDHKWSDAHDIPDSIRLTTVQPGGTKPLLAGVTPGGSSAKSEFYIRRVRFGDWDELLPELDARHYHMQYDINADGSEERSRIVVDFPCATPAGAALEPYETALDQLERVKRLQTLWSDNAVSCTIGYEADELPKIKEWLAQNYDTSVKSLSFLLKEGHGFKLAPIEPVEQSEYERLLFPIDQRPWRSATSSTELLAESCEGGACPVR